MEEINHIYVINLDRRKDRMDIIKKEMDLHNIQFERICAIDGNTLNQPVLNPFKIPIKYWNKYSLGLVKTFHKIINDAKEKKYKEIIIFEDDISLCDDFKNVFQEYKKQLPNNWDIVQLSAGNHRKHLQYITDNIFRTSRTMGTYALLINFRCFDKLINLSKTECAPIDDLISLIQRQKNCYMFYPGIVKPLPGYSDILNKNLDYQKYFQYEKSNYVEALIKMVKDKTVENNENN